MESNSQNLNDTYNTIINTEISDFIINLLLHIKSSSITTIRNILLEQGTNLTKPQVKSILKFMRKHMTNV